MNTAPCIVCGLWGAVSHPVGSLFRELERKDDLPRSAEPTVDAVEERACKPGLDTL